MRLLVVADVHGKYEKLQDIMDSIAGTAFDAVIAPGDFTDMFDIPPNFSQLDVADMVIQKLLIPNKPLLCVPGNHDPYDILDVFDDYGVNLHGRTKKVAGVVFAGWGGAVTPFNTLLEPPEEETAEVLGRVLKKVTGQWVLISHSPPKGTTLDMVKPKTHVGSAAIRDVILSKKPVLTITAHIHENRGTDMVGGSTVFYPGPAFDGYYGIVELGKRKAECHVRRTGA
ncbi:MAG: metallophosphoesterase [Candidatus Aenigmarchaeota archaeon]|nr:metallophosphoesterase [Candidatus Aenigmarchaeota archaeon]